MLGTYIVFMLCQISVAAWSLHLSAFYCRYRPSIEASYQLLTNNHLNFEVLADICIPELVTLSYRRSPLALDVGRDKPDI
jgi:hypothetical protein